MAVLPQFAAAFSCLSPKNLNQDTLVDGPNLSP
jgi:hypothetical protein